MQKIIPLKTHQEKRIVFAKKYIKTLFLFWKKIMWADKSKFNLVKSDGAQKL